MDTLRVDADLIARIDDLAQHPESRTLQKWAFVALAQSLRRWEKWWTFKLPTGTGKTRIFAHMLRAFQKNGVILVPRVDLYDSTARELRAVGFEERDIRFLHDETGNNTEDRMMWLLTDPSIDWGSGKIQCIMTYQALTAMVRKNPTMWDFMRDHFDIIIEDEAHRGLGDKTKAATQTLGENIEDEEIVEGEEIQLEQIAETILWFWKEKYSYKFTATPDLLGKSVEEDGEYLYYATVEEAIKTGAIILPQYVDMGAAYTKDANLEKWKIVDIEKLAEGDNFVDESGRSIRDKVIDAYIEKKEIHGTLAGVAFASTIEHAKQIVQAMEAKWIKATRVTSAPWDISSKYATDLMERWELDIIVTVTKVSEWFDYPPLACAMWFTPSLSPAKVFQGNGRIMRITDTKKPENVLDTDGRLCPSPSTYIIAPSAWYGGSSRTGWGGPVPPGWEPPEPPVPPGWEPPKPGKNILPRIGNFYELLIDRGELGIDSISGTLGAIVDMQYAIRSEPGEIQEIDSVKYVWVTHVSEVMGLKWNTVLNNAKKDKQVWEQCKIGRQKNGLNINLVPVSFIEGLRKEYICEVGEIQKIDSIQYIGVTRSSEYMGMKGFTILNNAKKDGSIWEQCKGGRQKNGLNISLVPLRFVDGLKAEYTCEPGEIQEIDGVRYVWVTQSSEYMGVRGWVIIDNARKDLWIWEQCKIGRQKSRYTITLVPVSFVEGVAKIYEPGEEIEIDNMKYVGVTQSSEYMGVRGWVIIDNARKDVWIWEQCKVGKQDSGHSITLVPVSFVDGLKVEYTCEPGEIQEIDGVRYIGVLKTTEVRGMKGFTILNNAKKEDIWKQCKIGRQKSRYTITLVPVSFVEGLAQKKKK